MGRGNFADLTGMSFDRLKVIQRAPDRISSSGHRKVQWECLCQCGTTHTADAHSLTNHLTKSCGCKSRDFLKSARPQTKHGQSKTRAYRSWWAMRMRCDNPATRSYKNYGAKGVSICERWRVFENFHADMGNPPTATHTIDRINADGPYEPRNCRWATAKEQANNKTNNHRLTYQGITQNITQWAESTGISRASITQRIKRGWTVADALTKPVKVVGGGR